MEHIRQAFAAGLAGFDRSRSVLIASHNDADGLAAAAILARAFAEADWPAMTRILGRGENPWSPEFRNAARASEVAGVIVADLGTRAGPILPRVPTVVIDHHVPAWALLPRAKETHSRWK